jgi:hypothetical protein
VFAYNTSLDRPQIAQQNDPPFYDTDDGVILEANSNQIGFLHSQYKTEARNGSEPYF